jgi:hypothetical protein
MLNGDPECLIQLARFTPAATMVPAWLPCSAAICQWAASTPDRDRICLLPRVLCAAICAASTQHQPTKLGWIDNEAVVIQRPLGMAF